MTTDTFRKAGIRLTEEMDPTLHREFDPGPWGLIRHALPAFHMFDKAHCLMLVEERIIPREAGKEILKNLRAMEMEGVNEARRSVGASKHSGEIWLTARLGEEVAGWLHVGRSSGDLGAVSDMITARGKVLDVWERTLGLRQTLLSLAAEHVTTVMPGYSHLQHAQPITFGFYLHSWEEAFRRDTQRLLQAYHRVNESPAGAAIMTGSDFPLNRHRVSELLGFDRPRTNCHDAIFHRDHLVEAACAIAILMTNAGRLADDLHLCTSNEFAMVDIPDRYCVTSSIMPQKKNPWSTQFVRGQYGRVMGRLAGIFATIKTLQDQIDPHYIVSWELWEMVDEVLPSLELLDGTLRGLRANRELMAKRAGQYWATATDLASALVRERRLPWRTSHQIVGILVRLVSERGIPPTGVTPALLDEAAMVYTGKPVGMDAEVLRRALDPLAFVQARTLLGGPAPETLERQIGEARRVLDEDREMLAGVRARLARAAKMLEAGIDAVLTG